MMEVGGALASTKRGSVKMNVETEEGRGETRGFTKKRKLKSIEAFELR